MVTIDSSNQALPKLEISSYGDEGSVVVAVFDNNNITKIENLEGCTALQQLSLGDNSITHISGLTTVCNLQVLNLCNNNITSINGVKTLALLRWLNLSGNRIKVIESLQSNVNLEHLDLSDNNISQLANINMLIHLQTLLLHGNNICNLRPVPNYFPRTITILSLAENDITDLIEVSHLSHLPALEQLSIMNNPCVMKTGLLPDFDYRPFVVNWCLNLRILDGYIVTEKEGLKAEWLFSQGKGRHFKPGEHALLIYYLSEECPLTSLNQSTEEEIRLSRVLQQQKVLQQSVDQQDVSGTGFSVMSGVSRGPVQVENPWQLDAIIKGRWPGQRDSERPHTAPSGPTHKARPTDRRPSGVPEDSRSRDSGDESSSMLDADSEFLPLHQDPMFSQLRAFELPQRPNTAPPKNSPPTSKDIQSKLGYGADPDLAPQTKDAWVDPADTRQSLRSPVTPQQRSIPVNYPHSPKMSPKSSPRACEGGSGSHRKLSASPVMRALDFRSAAAAEEAEVEGRSQTSVDLKIIKSILASKKNKPHKPVEVSHPMTAPRSASPKAYSPDQYQTGTAARRSLLTKQLKQFSGEDQGQDSAAARRLVQAATKIQAGWRGYVARHYNPVVLKVKDELRTRRTEDHICLLEAELAKQREMYEAEKQLRLLQLDVFKKILIEMKQNLAAGGSQHVPTIDHFISTITNPSLSGAKSPTSTETSEVTSSHTLVASLPSTDPQRTASCHCLSLQKQVTQLQEVLLSLSAGYTFPGAVIRAEKEPENDPVRVSLEFDESHKSSSSNCTVQGPSRDTSLTGEHSAVPTSPKAITMEAFTLPGVPTPPSNLRAQVHNSSSIILYWEPSEIYNSQGQHAAQPVIGYRIYVNGQPKGMVTGSQSRALLEGLQVKITYKMTIKAVSALGESHESKPVFVKLEGDPPTTGADTPTGGGGGRGGGGGGGRDSPSAGNGGSRRVHRPHSPGSRRPRTPSSEKLSEPAPKDTVGTSHTGDPPAQPKDTRGTTRPVSITPKNKQPVFDLHSPDSGYLTQGRQFKTFPPSGGTSPGVSPMAGSYRSESPSEGERMKRTSVVEKLFSSAGRSPSPARVEPEDSKNHRRSEGVEGVGADIGTTSGSRRVQYLLEKGLLSEEDIMKYFASHAKVSYLQNKVEVPLRPVTPLEEEVKASGSESKIPVFIAAAASNKSDGTVAKTGAAGRKKYSKSGGANVPRQDSSGSDSASPQISPTNTGSGVSMSGTTGSESSGSTKVHNKLGNLRKKSEFAAVLRQNSSSQKADASRRKSDSSPAHKVVLTKPNAPPIPPPSKTAVNSWAEKVAKPCGVMTGHKRSLSSGTVTELLSTDVIIEDARMSPAREVSGQSKLKGTYVLTQSYLSEVRNSVLGPSYEQPDYKPSFYRTDEDGGREAAANPQQPPVFVEDGSATARLRQSQSDGGIHFKAAKRLSFMDSSPEPGSVQSWSSGASGIHFQARSGSLNSDNSEEGLVKLPGSIEPDDGTKDRPPVTSHCTVIDSDDDSEIPFHRKIHHRMSAREPRRRIKGKTGPRSSSASSTNRIKTNSVKNTSVSRRNLEASTGTPTQTEVVPTSKPPTGRAVSPASVKPQAAVGTGRKRTTSEQSAHSYASDSGEDTSPQSTRYLSGHPPDPTSPSKPTPDTADTTDSHTSPSQGPKKIFAPKRTGSDLGIRIVLPDRPESPSPRRTPNTPQKAPGSPRVRRSSSFSRALPKTPPHSPATVLTGDGENLLRQCISLETLKAVKSKSQEMMNQSERQHLTLPENAADAIEDDKSSSARIRHASASHRGDRNETPDPSPLRRSSSLRDDRLLSNFASSLRESIRTGAMASESNVPGPAASESNRNGPVSAVIATGDNVTYSPRLTGKKIDDDTMSKPQRRIKLGSQASELFAKLEIKLSKS